jgi:hypothetical protein
MILASCGGGGSGTAEGWITFDFGDTRSTTSATFTTTGKASTPASARCHRPGGILGPPVCSCDIGDAQLTWTNAANGASGIGDAQLPVANPVACTPSTVWWRIADVPLAPGVNIITVTLSDDSSAGSGKLTVTRN